MTQAGSPVSEPWRSTSLGRVADFVFVLLALLIGAGSGSGSRTQLTAFFTSAPIFASSAAVNCFSAKEVGHMFPSSSFASSLKPNVAYLDLNLSAGVKKQTTLPALLA